MWTQFLCEQVQIVKVSPLYPFYAISHSEYSRTWTLISTIGQPLCAHIFCRANIQSKHALANRITAAKPCPFILYKHTYCLMRNCTIELNSHVPHGTLVNCLRSSRRTYAIWMVCGRECIIYVLLLLPYRHRQPKWVCTKLIITECGVCVCGLWKSTI